MPLRDDPRPRLYRELHTWYRLFTPVSEYLAEATCYREGLLQALGLDRGDITQPGAGRPGLAPTLLELGCGAGHNASYLTSRFACTLTDLSPDMLELSRELNPSAEHAVGDMRTLRLGRVFDAVLVHDAVMYMTTKADLEQAITTAFVHTRPGGAAIFAPDYVREAFSPGTDADGSDRSDGSRGVRFLEWRRDPDPNDDTYTVDYALLLREGNDVRVEHDRHIEGLFARATWLELLGRAGYEVESIPRPLDDHGEFDQIFLARRPAR
jgi:SAM-dependent methyltransferase